MSGLSHLDEQGQLCMVDIGGKPITQREAEAEAFVFMSAETLKLLSDGEIKKGNVLTTAHLAGVMAAKQTDKLIPLCHSLPLSVATVDFDLDTQRHCIHIRAVCKTSAQTGVEMEALTAVSVAALTIIDMCKAVDKAMRIEGIRVLRKSGGRSGVYLAS